MRVPRKCSVCGVSYRDYRAPDQPTFADVVEEMYVSSSDRSKWKRRSKGNVLGKMHEHKAASWLQHIDQCEEASQAGFDPFAAVWDDVPF